MKPLRIGAPRAEKPAILDAADMPRDPSGRIDGLSGDALLDETLDRLCALERAGLPPLAADSRIVPEAPGPPRGGADNGAMELGIDGIGRTETDRLDGPNTRVRPGGSCKSAMISAEENMMKSLKTLGLAAALTASCAAVAGAQTVLEKGQEADMVLLPKFLGILVFDQAHEGAREAHAELGNPGELLFVGPTPENSVSGQIEIMTTSATQGQDAVMLSNNAGDQITPAARAAQKAGTRVVTWDSPIPSGEGEDVFVAQVDFASIGTVMADMAHSILGGAGQMAVLSATPDAANQNAWIASMQEALKGAKYANIELVDVVYGDDQSEVSYNRALSLIDQYPNLGIIMSPTTVGIQAASKAMQDEGMCDRVKVSGLGLPSEMASYTMNGCAPEFALWDFRDLGYLTYYTAYGLATGQLSGEIGEIFTAGRMGDYAIEEDPGRSGAKRILMGPFTVYTRENVEAAAQ